MEVFLAPNPILYASALILGLIVGSFLNVLILRLPKMYAQSWRDEGAFNLCESAIKACPKCHHHYDLDEAPTTVSSISAQSECPHCHQNEQFMLYDCAIENERPAYNLIKPDSHCPNCDRPIRAWENIPVLSYLFLRGRCAGCATSISIRYPTVELITGILTLLLTLHYGFTLQALAAIVLVWGLIALTMIDYDHYILPDQLTLPLMWLGIIVNMQGMFTPLTDSLWGAIFGYLSLWSVYWIYKLLTGKEGFGAGDFKLLAMLGAWMGWQYLFLIILLSAFVGSIIGLSLIVGGRNKDKHIPFGPYLAGAGAIALIWGNDIIAFYWQI